MVWALCIMQLCLGAESPAVNPIDTVGCVTTVTSLEACAQRLQSCLSSCPIPGCVCLHTLLLQTLLPNAKYAFCSWSRNA